MTHASVFSGIGGPEVAATMLGWLFNETEPYKWIDKVYEYIYNKVKDELLS